MLNECRRDFSTCLIYNPCFLHHFKSPGRTGRVGNTGKATSFFDAEGDGDVAGKLVDMLTKTGVEVPDCLSEAGAGGCGGGRQMADGIDCIICLKCSLGNTK